MFRFSTLLVSLVGLLSLISLPSTVSACDDHPSTKNCAIYGTGSGGNSAPIVINNKTGHTVCFYLCQNDGGYTSMALTFELGPNSSGTAYFNEGVYYSPLTTGFDHLWLERGGVYSTMGLAQASGGYSSFNIYSSSSGSTSRRRLLSIKAQADAAIQEQDEEIPTLEETSESGEDSSPTSRRLLSTISYFRMSPA